MEGIDISHLPAALHPLTPLQDDASTLHAVSPYNPGAALSKRPHGPPSKMTIREVIKDAKKINSAQVTPTAISPEFHSPFCFKDDEIIGKGNTTVEVLLGASRTELQFDTDNAPRRSSRTIRTSRQLFDALRQ